MKSTLRCVVMGGWILAGALPAFADNVCGDVNGDQNVAAGDALSVLRKAVGQDIDLVCPIEEELTSCERNLSAWQPIECPCFTGPADLAEMLASNVTGTVTPLYFGQCYDDDAGTQTYRLGVRSDNSAPDPGVPGDGKCRVIMEAVVNPFDGSSAPLCTVTQTIDDDGDEADCASVPVFPIVKHTGIQIGEALACKEQAQRAVSLVPGCAM